MLLSKSLQSFLSVRVLYIPKGLGVTKGFCVSGSLSVGLFSELLWPTICTGKPKAVGIVRRLAGLWKPEAHLCQIQLSSQWASAWFFRLFGNKMAEKQL